MENKSEPTFGLQRIKRKTKYNLTNLNYQREIFTNRLCSSLNWHRTKQGNIPKKIVEDQCSQLQE